MIDVTVRALSGEVIIEKTFPSQTPCAELQRLVATLRGQGAETAACPISALQAYYMRCRTFSASVQEVSENRLRSSSSSTACGLLASSMCA